MLQDALTVAPACRRLPLLPLPPLLPLLLPLPPGAVRSQAGEIGLGGRRSWTKRQLCDAGISAAVEAAERHAGLLKMLADEGQHRHKRCFFECQLAPTTQPMTWPTQPGAGSGGGGPCRIRTFRPADCPVCADYTGWQAAWVSASATY